MKRILQLWLYLLVHFCCRPNNPFWIYSIVVINCENKTYNILGFWFSRFYIFTTIVTIWYIAKRTIYIALKHGIEWNLFPKEVDQGVCSSQHPDSIMSWGSSHLCPQIDLVLLFDRVPLEYHQTSELHLPETGFYASQLYLIKHEIWFNHKGSYHKNLNF